MTNRIKAELVLTSMEWSFTTLPVRLRLSYIAQSRVAGFGSLVSIMAHSPNSVPTALRADSKVQALYLQH